MNKLILAVLVFFTSVAVHSQKTDEKNSFDKIKERLNVGFESNSQWYLNDDKTGDFDEDEKLRANSYLRIDYQISERFSSRRVARAYLRVATVDYPSCACRDGRKTEHKKLNGEHRDH